MTFSTVKNFTAVLLVFLTFFLQSCVNKTNENQSDKINLQDIDLARQERIIVNGINVSPDIFVNWSNGQQRREKLTNLIEKSLKKDKIAFNLKPFLIFRQVFLIELHNKV